MQFTNDSTEPSRLYVLSVSAKIKHFYTFRPQVTELSVNENNALNRK